MAMTSEWVAAINQIAAEKGIEKEEVLLALESAILSAIKKEKFGRVDRDEDIKEGANLSVEVDRETGEFKLFGSKEVVKNAKDNELEISLSEAEMISPSVEIGDFVQIEMPMEEFGRIATQTAKQVLLQKIRESEKDAVMSEFSDKVGEVYSALMQRMQRGSAIFEIGKATAVMPLEEQISNEFYRVGERYKVLLKSVDDSVILVSRADPNFLKELFKMEVPEIESGVVEIKAIAREAGSRSKIAVVSHQDGIDPIGSCVGQRGVRIANVMNELGEEKIDIIEWDDSPEEFVANALSPAKVDSVKIDGDTAVVDTPSDQLSLAIGRDGQNARLAWKLTGLRIDIVGPEGEVIEKPEEIEKEKVETEDVAEEKPKKAKTNKKKTKEDKKEEVVEEPKDAVEEFADATGEDVVSKTDKATE
jgi:N utilization substance protein A